MFPVPHCFFVFWYGQWVGSSRRKNIFLSHIMIHSVCVRVSVFDAWASSETTQQQWRAFTTPSNARLTNEGMWESSTGRSLELECQQPHTELQHWRTRIHRDRSRERKRAIMEWQFTDELSQFRTGQCPNIQHSFTLSSVHMCLAYSDV